MSLNGNSRNNAAKHSKLVAKGVWQNLGTRPISNAVNTDVAITTSIRMR
jgi:hypothetical protein